MTDQTIRSRFFETRDGLNLHAAILVGASQSAPVVCLPGLTRPARDFHPLARFLRGRTDRSVICLDYRGRGGSDWDPDWRHYSFPVELADILFVLEQLAVTSAFFVGTSRGGLHGMTIAAMRPELVKGLVLNDVGPVLDPGGLAHIRDYVGRLPLLLTIEEAVAHFREAMGAQFTAVSDDEWRIYAANSLNPTAERLRLSYDPQLARTLEAIDPAKPLPDLWEQFAAVTAPVLALRAENSDLFAPETLAEMAARNPRCRTHVVPGQGHAPMLLDAATQGLIADFIAEIESP